MNAAWLRPRWLFSRRAAKALLLAVVIIAAAGYSDEVAANLQTRNGYLGPYAIVCDQGIKIYPTELSLSA